MTDARLARWKWWVLVAPIGLGLALTGCKHPPGAERARQCVEAHVLASWAECKTAGVKCSVTEVDVESHDDGPTETVMRVTATVASAAESGDQSKHPVHFTVTLTPTEDGEYACADVADDRAGSLTVLPH